MASKSTLENVFLGIFCLVLVLCRVSEVTCQSNCYEDGIPTRCMPPERPFSLGKPVTANNTCGDPPNAYCRRTSPFPPYPLDCDQVCNASDPVSRRPASHLVDLEQIPNQSTSWQSRTVGPEEDVAITLSLQAQVEISLIVMVFTSPVPESFYIEKSNGTSSFEPFQYFSMSCLSTYGLMPDTPPPASDEAQALCSDLGSDALSSTVVAFLPASSRPSANDSAPGVSQAVHQFSTAADLRILLDRSFLVPTQPPSDTLFSEAYFYSLSNIQVLGRLQCHGHASSSGPAPDDGSRQVCQCQHQTTGDHCERCLEFHHDAPWRWATGASSDIECRMCQCNSHSSSCFFNQTAYDLTASGGQCLDCADSTAGQHCQQCASLHYHDASRSLDDPATCIACDCHTPGVRDGGDCVREASSAASLGQCYCKANTDSRDCSQCRPGYFNLSAGNPDGCSECGCHQLGSVGPECDSSSGQCSCRPNVVGDKCDRCVVDHFNLSSSGCQPCQCVPGASTGSCEPGLGQCPCRRGLEGLNCDLVQPGTFVPAMDHLLLEAEFAPPLLFTVSYQPDPGPYSGLGYAAVREGSVLEFGNLTAPHSGLYRLAVRYSLTGLDAWRNATLRVWPIGGDVTATGSPAECADEIVAATNIPFGGWVVGMATARHEVVCLRAGQSYAFRLSVESPGAALPSPSPVQFLVDSLLLVPHGPDRLPAVLGQGQVELLQSCVVAHSLSLASAAAPGQACREVFFSVATVLYNGTLECGCGRGSASPASCSPEGGQCSCIAASVRGRDCSYCAPTFYDLTSQGCSACECHSEGSQSPVCSVDGTCPCKASVEARDCSQCSLGHFNLSAPQGCVSCRCNDTGTVGGACDQASGQCACGAGVGGPTCGTCLASFYGFSSSGCQACGCSADGADGVGCDLLSGQCQCKSLTTGQDCATCADGSFNLLGTNPAGCQPCFCSGLGVTCSAAEGFVAGTLLSSSVRLLEWTVVDSSLQSTEATLEYQTNSDTALFLNNSGTYISAPEQFLGNKLSSYGQPLSFTYSTGLGPSSTGELDVLLTGPGDSSIGAAFLQTSLSPGLVTASVLVQAGSGWVDTASTSTATAQQILSVLADVRQLAVRVQLGGNLTLHNISLSTAVARGVVGGGVGVAWVEQCACPANYTGLSCQLCSAGYYRVADGSCQACQCGGLSDTCDRITGACTNCSDLTAGDHCEVCVEGAFGDPPLNISCQPCPCPLTSGPGQFSSTCRLSLSGGGGAECTACPPGHSAPNCQSCEGGYFGDPTGSVTGEPKQCSNCSCNGNIDPLVPDSCNRSTGVCLICTGNATGGMCELCEDAFYGDAVTAKNCTECGCSEIGSNSTRCHADSGQCSCRPNVEGRTCAGCRVGYYNFTSGQGCSECGCSEVGSTTPNCLPSGECLCQRLVAGRTCDRCQGNAYNYSVDGCTDCGCSVVGSMGGACSNATGQCFCRFGYTGRRCEQCLPGYFSQGNSCLSCPGCYLEVLQVLNSSQLALEGLSTELADLETSLLGEESFVERLSDVRSQVDDQMVAVRGLVARDGSLSGSLGGLTSQLEQLSTNISAVRTMLNGLNDTTTIIQARALGSLSLLGSLEARLTNVEALLRALAAMGSQVAASTTSLEGSAALAQSLLFDLTSLTQALSMEASTLGTVAGNATVASAAAANASGSAVARQAAVSGMITALLNGSQFLGARAAGLMREVDSALQRSSNVLPLLSSQRTAPYSPPTPASIASVNSSATGLVYQAMQLQGQLDWTNTTMAAFSTELTAIEAMLDSLALNASLRWWEAGSLWNRSVAALQSSVGVANSSAQLLAEGQQLLLQVEQFSSLTAVAQLGSSSSLASVAELEGVARASLRLAVNITGMLSEVAQLLGSAHQLASALLTQANQVQNNVSQVSLPSSIVEEGAGVGDIVASLSRSQDAVLAALWSARQQCSQLTAADALSSTASSQRALSSSLQTAASAALSSLLSSLSSLQPLNPQALQELAAGTASLRTDLAAPPVHTDALLQARQQLDAQRNRNDRLEADIRILEQNIYSLRELYTSLPMSCQNNV